MDVSLNTINPEPNALEVTPEQIKLNEFRQKLAMYAASLEREVSRIKFENAVRIGDSVIAEAVVCGKVVTALRASIAEYKKLIP